MKKTTVDKILGVCGIKPKMTYDVKSNFCVEQGNK